MALWKEWRLSEEIIIGPTLHLSICQWGKQNEGCGVKGEWWRVWGFPSNYPMNPALADSRKNINFEQRMGSPKKIQLPTRSEAKMNMQNLQNFLNQSKILFYGFDFLASTLWWRTRKNMFICVTLCHYNICVTFKVKTNQRKASGGWGGSTTSKYATQENARNSKEVQISCLTSRNCTFLLKKWKSLTLKEL